MPAPERNQRQDKSNGHQRLPRGQEPRTQLQPNLWFWWLIFAALLAWNLFAWWPAQSSTVNIPYSTFLTQVRANNVAKVHIVADDISGEFVKPVLWPAYLIPTLIGAAVAYAPSGEASVVFSQRLRQAPKLSQPIGLKAREIMRTHIVGAQADATLQEFFANVAAHNRHPTYPVFKDNRVIGSISLWEIAQVPSSRWNGVKIGEAARYNLPQVGLDTDLREVVRLMNQQQRHRLVLVVDPDSVPAGLITPSDIISALSVEEEAETEASSQSDATAPPASP